MLSTLSLALLEIFLKGLLSSNVMVGKIIMHISTEEAPIRYFADGNMPVIFTKVWRV